MRGYLELRCKIIIVSQDNGLFIDKSVSVRFFKSGVKLFDFFFLVLYTTILLKMYNSI